MGFKDFLLNEESNYLGRRIGDVLDGAQNVQNDMENLGARHLNRLAEKLVNQMRKILHGSWTEKQHRHLIGLQKIAVALQKTIEDKGDLKQVLPAATAALQQLSVSMGVKVNDLQAPPEEGGEEVSQDDFQLTGDGPQQQMPQQPQQQMPQQQQPQGQDPMAGMNDPMGGMPMGM